MANRMQKYWPGKSVALCGAVYATGMVIADALFSDHPYPAVAIAVAAVGYIALYCPMMSWIYGGIWQSFWVADGTVFEQHLLTRRIRSMKLDARYVSFCPHTGYERWLVVAEHPVTVESMRQVKALRRKKQVMLVPVEGCLLEPLQGWVDKAKELS